MRKIGENESTRSSTWCPVSLSRALSSYPPIVDGLSTVFSAREQRNRYIRRCRLRQSLGVQRCGTAAACIKRTQSSPTFSDLPICLQEVAHNLYIYCFAITIRLAVNLGMSICFLCCLPCLLLSLALDPILVLLELGFGIGLIASVGKDVVSDACVSGNLLWYAKQDICGAPSPGSLLHSAYADAVRSFWRLARLAGFSACATSSALFSDFRMYFIELTRSTR